MCWFVLSIPSVRTLLIAHNRLSGPAYLSKGGFIGWTAEQRRACAGLREGWIPEGWQSYRTSDFSSSLCSVFCLISLIICLHILPSLQQLSHFLYASFSHRNILDALCCVSDGDPCLYLSQELQLRGCGIADEPATLELKPGSVHLKQMAATPRGRSNCSKSEYSQQKEDNRYWKAMIKCPLNAFYQPGAPSGIQELHKLF